MKAQLPIVIGLAILAGLILASMFYVVSLTTYTKEISKGPAKNSWELLDGELDTLDLVALRYGSIKAYENFSLSFSENYTEIGYSIELVDRAADYYADFKSSSDLDDLEIDADNYYLDTVHGKLVMERANGYARARYTKSFNPITSSNIYIAYVGTADNHVDWFIDNYILYLWFTVDYYAYFLGNNYDEDRLEVNYYSGGTTTLEAQSSTVPHPHTFYGHVEMSYRFRRRNIIYRYTAYLDVYDAVNDAWATINYNYRDSISYWFDMVNYIGVAGYNRVILDKLVISSTRDPKYIYFEGLPPNGKVGLSNGTVEYLGNADNNGNAQVFFPDLIWRNAVIKVYDPQGRLLFSKRFDIIVGGDLYKFSMGTLSSYDFYTALANFKTALENASSEALNVLREEVLRIIRNWIDYKTREGYSIKISYFKPFYNITLWTKDYVSYGLGSVGFNITYSVLSPWGEYREFVKSLNASYLLEFSIGYPYGFYNMTLPMNLTAKLMINGVEYSYMQPRQLLRLRIYSVLFATLPCLEVSSGGNHYVDLLPVKTLYSRSEVVAYYKIYYWKGTDIAAMNLYDDIVDYLVGSPYRSYYNRFLWATISLASIDGIKVPSALKIAFIINYYWGTLQVRIYGDENRPITPLT